MVEQKSPIAVIPSECFRWRARVQFIESFRTRAAALDYASQHGHNLIVERQEKSNPLYDVLEDPDWACTTGLDLELLGTEEVLIDPGPSSWTMLLFSTIWDLSKRFAVLMILLYARVIVPLSRRAFAIARIYLRKSAPLLRRAAAITAVYLWKIIPLTRRAAALTAVYLRKMIPIMRRATALTIQYFQEEIIPGCRSFASRCWWSNGGLAFRRTWHRHSHGSALDLARRSAAVGSLHAREISHHVGDVASRFQWSDVVPAIRLVWRVSLLAGRDSAGRFAAAVVALYQHELVPRFRDAAGRYEWSDVKGAFRYAWRISFSIGLDLSRLIAAAVAAIFLGMIVPFFRRTATALRTYFREADQRARSAAWSLSDSKSDSSRNGWAVAAQRQSNPSRIR